MISISKSCRKCGKKEYIELPENATGYRSVICKHCRTVAVQYDPHGKTVEILLPRKNAR